MKIRFQAILTTVTPLHIATPGAYRLNDRGYVEAENASNDNKQPVTAIQRLKMTDASLAVPVIAANNIAGRLRRHAAEQLLNAVRAGGKKVSLQAYSSLMCGAVGGAPDKRDLTYQEYLKSSAHPYIGLMGGGPRMLPRKMRVLNAVPVCSVAQDLMGSLMHPNASDYLQNPVHLTQVWSFRRNDDLMDLVNVPQQASSIENYEQEIQERQAKIMADKAKGDRAKDSTFTFSAFEFVVPGANFNLVFELDCNEVQFGLFLKSLDSFAEKERLGGHSRNGLGAFSLSNVIMSVAEANDPDSDGLYGCDGESDNIFDQGRLNGEHKAVKPYLIAWANAAANVDVATIEEMMTLPSDFETKAEKDAKKAAKKAAKTAQ